MISSSCYTISTCDDATTGIRIPKPFCWKTKIKKKFCEHSFAHDIDNDALQKELSIKLSQRQLMPHQNEIVFTIQKWEQNRRFFNENENDWTKNDYFYRIRILCNTQCA